MPIVENKVVIKMKCLTDKQVNLLCREVLAYKEELELYSWDNHAFSKKVNDLTDLIVERDSVIITGFEAKEPYIEKIKHELELLKSSIKNTNNGINFCAFTLNDVQIHRMELFNEFKINVSVKYLSRTIFFSVTESTVSFIKFPHVTKEDFIEIPDKLMTKLREVVFENTRVLLVTLSGLSVKEYYKLSKVIEGVTGY